MAPAPLPVPPAQHAPADGLSEREREILAFERQWWKYAGAKEAAVRDLFGMSATRYYQVLNALIDRPDALVADPMLVKRLRRLRATRQRTRSARRLGTGRLSTQRPGLRRRLPAPSQDRPATSAWWSPVRGTPEVPGPRTAGGDVDLDGPTVDVPVLGADAVPAELADADTGPLPLPARPGGRTRVPRAPRPAALPPARALLGAAVAVAGVLLGIGTLLWATDAPDAGPAARPASAGGGDEPAVALPEDGAPAETESAPVDPPPLPEPVVVEAPAPAAAPPAPAPAEPPAAAPVRPAVQPVPVLVLNNSRVEGLAARAAATFERAGWPVRDTGSLRGRIRATTVYYPPGQQAVAQEFARRFDGVERVLPRLAGLPGTGLTVVVTRDFRP